MKALSCGSEVNEYYSPLICEAEKNNNKQEENNNISHIINKIDTKTLHDFIPVLSISIGLYNGRITNIHKMPKTINWYIFKDPFLFKHFICKKYYNSKSLT